MPGRCEELFELLVGLAQRRFFDRPCAVAMARALHDLIVAFLDAPQLHPARVWMLGDRATVGHEMLLVNRDFSINGHTRTWRLTDGDARAWVLGMLTDCAAKVVTAYAVGNPALLLEMHDITCQSSTPRCRRRWRSAPGAWPPGPPSAGSARTAVPTWA